MPHLPLTEASIKNTIDVKANGEVSRMRSHKGNMPSLPQTKYCALCPAKFTRTTHLNRHLRSHTNERAHRCNICNAEFTRSDLLTRHKRTCGDSSNVNRSRRKSCQACAESKVKCNLQQPCSKCSARGRECIFINDPEASRNRKLAKHAAQSSHSLSPSEAPSNSLPSLVASSPTSSFMAPGRGLESHLHPSKLKLIRDPRSSVSQTSDQSSECSSQSSPRLDLFEQSQSSNTFNPTFGALVLGTDMNDILSNVLDPFMNDGFSPCLPRAQVQAQQPNWFETARHSDTYGTNEPNLYNHLCHPNDLNFVNRPANLNPNSASSSKTSFSRHQFIPAQNPARLSSSSVARNPTSEEMEQHYLYTFFAEYNVQYPLVHRATWTENSHPLLVSAMKACGALSTKTQTALQFIITTLTSSLDILIVEFSKPTCSFRDQEDLILATILLQSIITSQPRLDQRPLAKSYHEILVMMIRQIGLIKFVNSWTPPDLGSPQILESAWNDWAHYETLKRALGLAYLQDCTYCIFFSASPSFSLSEFDLNLPCDDVLWKAQSSREWYQIQNMFSVYGAGKVRILGISTQVALSTLNGPISSPFHFTVNPFSAFILIHSILRDIFFVPNASHHRASVSSLVNDPMAIQTALHNWHRMWSSIPEAINIDHHNQAPWSVFHAMPFYWLASHADAQKTKCSLGPRGNTFLRMSAEERYLAVHEWLDHLTAMHRNDSQVLPNWGADPQVH